MPDGRWQMANTGWQMADAGWQMANTGWQTANAGWQMANAGWQMANAGWQTTNAGWRIGDDKRATERATHVSRLPEMGGPFRSYFLLYFRGELRSRGRSLL